MSSIWPGRGVSKGKEKLCGNLPAAECALLRLFRLADKFVKTQVQPFFVSREIERDVEVQGIPVPGGDEMKGQRGDNLVFEPGEVAVGEELKTIGMGKGVAGEPACKFPDIEAGLDLFDPGEVVPEDPVHPSVDPEPVSFPLEGRLIATSAS